MVFLFIAGAGFNSMSYESYWKCVCGAYTHPSRDQCTRCGYLRSSRQTDRVATCAKPEQDSSDESLGETTRASTNATKCRVRFTCYRVRLLDDDNRHVKYFTDALCKAGILFDDSPKWAQIEVTQVEVNHRSQERTEITITQFRDIVNRP